MAPPGAQGWAEGALEMAEGILSKKMGLPKPAWVSAEDYAKAMDTMTALEDQRTGAAGGR